ncbi:hypothetical protein EC973_006584 [Apophysomyces ossiformis]|uniref:Uncharacterized protein n=1 Tax=Apophysomyces ossiformis TaxID=679940 RepID=A0A8H7BW73_9FUNG|nr:hypothetical protein EC973_006584 [Apophysomyces ossiformis]
MSKRVTTSTSRTEKLIDEAKLGHVVLDVFNPDPAGSQWRCPFCCPPEFVMKTPPASNKSAMEKVRTMIGQHLALHRSDVLGQMSRKELEEYEKVTQRMYGLLLIHNTTNSFSKRAAEGHAY